MAFTPPQSTTVNWDSLVSTTLNNTRAQRFDNIYRKSAAFAFLHTQGRKELVDGGVKVDRMVDYAVNGTIDSYEGYDPVDLTPQEHTTIVQDELRELAGSIVISRREERQNSGRAAIVSLITSKIENLDRSFGQFLNEQVLAPRGTSLAIGNGGKDLNPLTELVSTTAKTVHGINESNDAWWANQRKSSGSVNDTDQSLTQFKSEWRNFYNTCGKHNDGNTNLVLTGQIVEEKYEESLEGQVRYGSVELANLGFETVMLRGATVMWDEICPRSTNNTTGVVLYSTPTTDTSHEWLAYFLNTDFIKLYVDAQTDLVNRPFMDSVDQTAKSALVLFMGQLMTTNRRAQGVLYNIGPDQY